MPKVFLSAGHGGKDPGAVAYGLKEKNINLNILLACIDELKRHGVTVVTSRTKDEDDPVNEEVKEANASKADIAVSFHTNAGKGDGSETYYYSTSSKGKRLAELCEKHTKAIGQNSRGIKTGDKLRFVNGTDMTAVLCECAFVDNNTDNNIIDTTAEQKKFGVAYAKAILEYFGIEYKAKSTASTSFLIKIANVNKGDKLNVRYKPDPKSIITDKISWNDPNKYTITETKKVGDQTWGKLKSGLGWINLYYTKRV